MALIYEVDEQRQLVRITASAAPSVEEWFDTLGRAIEEPRFQPGFDFLYDRTHIENMPDLADVRRWVARLPRLLCDAGAGWFAAVVPREDVLVLLRTACAQMEERGTAADAFRTEAEALRWLGTKSGTGKYETMP